MCKKCETAIANSDWWEPFVPLSHETPKQYLSRARHFDEYGMNFVMMRLDNPSDLVTVGHAFNIIAVRHQYEPGRYAVQVVRDLVFLAYTQEFEDLTW
jgi:hypothetical protein